MNDAPCTLWQLIRYFLWLGSFGFGGPIALAGLMQRDLVESKRWISKEDFLHGLALSKLCPGPLATQLAMYLGWVRSGKLGATAIGLAFVLPSFLMVLALAAFYVHYGNFSWMASALYGIGAAVIAIIIRSAWKLANLTNSRDPLLWIICAINALSTVWFASEIVWLFVLSGLIIMLIKAPPGLKSGLKSVMWPAWLFSGLHGTVTSSTLLKLLLYFAWAGTFVFGSGLAIVPLLHDSVVNSYKWLTERQFIDAVAVAMITPGPAVITVAFIGYLVAGVCGALLAAIGVFIPVYLFVILLSPYYRRVVSNQSINAFVTGVTAAAAGAMAGAAFIIGKQAISDWITIAIFLVTSLLICTAKQIPDPLLIVAAGVAGFLFLA